MALDTAVLHCTIISNTTTVCRTRSIDIVSVAKIIGLRKAPRRVWCQCECICAFQGTVLVALCRQFPCCFLSSRSHCLIWQPNDDKETSTTNVFAYNSNFGPFHSALVLCIISIIYCLFAAAKLLTWTRRRRPLNGRAGLSCW